MLLVASPRATAQVAIQEGVSVSVAPSVVLTEPGSSVGLAVGYAHELSELWEVSGYLLVERNSDRRGFHSFEGHALQLGIGAARDLGKNFAWVLGIEQQIGAKDDGEDWEGDGRTTWLTGFTCDVLLGEHLSVTPEITGETDGSFGDFTAVFTVTLGWGF